MIPAPNVASRGPSKALQRGTLLAAGLMAAGVLALDLATGAWLGIGSLYVVPLLLTVLAAPPRAGVLAGWGASVLIMVGLLKAPWAAIPLSAFVNRGIALVEIWTVAIIAQRFHDTSARLEQRTRDLADVNFALDQSAIVAITDLKGRITYANEKFCEISGYSRDELIGQDHRIVNSGYHSQEFIRTLWRTIGSGEIWRGEIRNRAKSGRFYWVDTTIVPFLDADGKPYQYMAIRYEITDRKRSEDQLREQAALTRLGQMAAVVAHEVKNPIAGIRGALQVLASRMPAEQRDRIIIGDIIGRLDALNAIVEDMLLFARPRQLRLEPVDVGAIVGATAELVRRDPALAGVTVRMNGGGGPSIDADRELLQIVFLNVIMNAAQAMGGQGMIDVAIGLANGVLRVSVADTGPGMPAEVREKAFEPFFTTKHRGTGLGLPIARHIVEAHGGAILIDVPPSGGTVISVDLPTTR